MTAQGSAMTTTAEHRRSGARGSAWRLSRPWRRTVLIAHIVSAGAWIGIDVIVAVLVLTGWFSPDVEVRSLAYRALAHFIVIPMLTSGLICLITGGWLGWGTPWGLVRYWWVAAKLAINLALCTVMVVVLAPGMDDVDRYGRSLLAGTPDHLQVATLFFPPAVSLTTLTFATVLAVVKPWGRIRAGRARGLRRR